MDMIGSSIAYAFYANTLFYHTVLGLHVVEPMAQIIHSGLRCLIPQNIPVCCSFLSLTVDEGQKYFSLSFLLLFL